MAEIAAMIAAEALIPEAVAAAGSTIASTAAASTLAQGAMMGAAIGGGIPALTGGNRNEILKGVLGGGLTGGVGAGIAGLAGGQTLAQLLGTEAAGAGAGAGFGGIDASQAAANLGVPGIEVSTLPGSQSAMLAQQQSMFGPEGLESLRAAAEGTAAPQIPTQNVGDPNAFRVGPIQTGGANLFQNPLQYGMENLKGVVVPSALAGAMAAQPQTQMPTEDDRYNPLRRQRWGTGTYRWTGAQGGIASLPGSDNFSNYDLLVGDTDTPTPRMMAGGGEADLGSYSDGGRMLRGPGDGMSDSIPGVIANKRPAQLADGEFVVPADVVSHLGNGSTDAGARQLYAMMDKVRKARTGTKRQGREINPRQFVPA